jgi:hypothetical protein
VKVCEAPIVAVPVAPLLSVNDPVNGPLPAVSGGVNVNELTEPELTRLEDVPTENCGVPYVPAFGDEPLTTANAYMQPLVALTVVGAEVTVLVVE